MTPRIRMTAMVMLASLGLGIFTIGGAEASPEGKRNTAIGLGAVAVYGVVKKKPLVAGLAGGGAIYSYMKSREAAKKQRASRARRARVARSRRGSRYYYVRRNGRLVRVARR